MVADWLQGNDFYFGMYFLSSETTEATVSSFQIFLLQRKEAHNGKTAMVVLDYL